MDDSPDTSIAKLAMGLLKSQKKDPPSTSPKSSKMAAATADSTPEDKHVIVTPESSDGEEAVAVGMECGIKELYSGPEDKHGRFEWLKKPPKDLGIPAEDAETAKKAIIVRHVKVYNDPRRVLRIHSIVVQSPLLKKFLGAVLKGYPGVTTSLQRLEFSDRFEPLIHRWPQLKEAFETEKDEETKKHAALLFEVLEKEFKDTIDDSLDQKKNKVITYQLLWTLFQPGDVLYTRRDGQETALTLLDAKYGQDPQGNPIYVLNTQYVDWDGTKFGTQKLSLFVDSYSGTSAISKLAVHPMAYHPKETELKQRLIQRGAKIEGLAGSHYKSYNGIGWRKNQYGQKDKYNIKGRIVIDTASWNRFNPNMNVFVTPFTRSNVADNPGDLPYSRGQTDSHDSEDESRSSGEEEDDDVYSNQSDDMPTDGLIPENDDDAASKKKPLTDEQRLITYPLLRGYALQTKQWLNFFINPVREIEWSEDAFASLVLPENQKELILGFTETQRKMKQSFDDVIKGKGKGIILLLSGEPGVGKTLTAESVAEEMRVPLYMMSAGDLGLDPRTVESKLTNILEMCAKWGAILLIDEADVFLEQRSLHELERNKLVSIFLRILEYYEGIMFLTTNRVQTFDAAFQSRIHISLDYPNLTAESRRAVWKNFLTPSKKAGGSFTGIENTISETQLDRLSLVELNGRQIKNVLKTAQLLASRRETKLNFEHVNTVLDVTQHLHNATRETDRQRSAIFC